MITIEDRHLKIILDILRKYPYTFYAFGSRANGKPSKLSDLDICFKESIPLNIQAHIEEAFDNSDLPFKIDLCDWNLMEDNFKKLIQNDLTKIEK